VKTEELPDILPQLASGGEKAFRKVYEKYNPMLRFFCLRYCNDKENANDVVQEVFVKLWEAHLTFKDETALRSYLFKTARSLCLNQLRHDKVKDRYTQFISQQEHYDSFLEDMMEAEIFSILNRIFEEIPPACKEVYLCSLEGKKHSEIAERFHISVNSVKKYKNRAHHFLRNKIKIIFPDKKSSDDVYQSSI
jgi:RNA polymerase sigma-70 factor (family 1)